MRRRDYRNSYCSWNKNRWNLKEAVYVSRCAEARIKPITIIYPYRVFHWSLNESMSPQVCRILLSILAVLNNAVVGMVSTRPPTSKSSSPFNNPLFTVPKAPITIGIIVNCMFHSFFHSLARSWYLSVFSHSFIFIQWSAGTANLTILKILCFLLIIIRSGLFPRLDDPCVCQSPIGVYVCYFLGQVLVCAYTISSYGQF